MFLQLAQIFEDFLQNIASGNQWTYIFVGLFIFIILLYALINMVGGIKNV